MHDGQQAVLDGFVLGYFLYEVAPAKTQQPDGSLHPVRGDVRENLLHWYQWSESTYSEKESETVPLASTQAVLDEVEPLLPTEAVETINAKIAEVKTPDNAIPQKDWVGIISIIVTILLFLAGQALSSEHDKKEESSWSATAEYQQEMLEIQREEAERSENFRQRTEEHFKIVEDTNERIAEALEMLANQSVELDDRGQSVLDSDDSQDDAEDQDSIQAAQQEQADAED